MARKWEKAVPVIEEYLSYHESPYLNEMVEDLNISAYVIETALDKIGAKDRINHGLSPERKAIRDKKISENISKQYAEGTFPKIDYDDEWKAKCKAGSSHFWNSPELVEAAAAKRDQTCRLRYGNNYRQLFRKKGEDTLIDRYGSASYNNPEQARKTRLERYGDPNYNNREKASVTCAERYGGVGNASPELLSKYESTMLERYGVKTNLLSEDPELSGTSAILNRFGSMEARYKYSIEKGQETKLKEHGDRYWNNPEKVQQTMIEKYGVKYYLELPEARRMQPRSKLSIKYFEDVLIPLYGESNIESEYKDKDRSILL